MTSTFKGRAMTVGAASAGVLIFHLLGLPLPFLFGPLFGCLIAALAGAPLKGFGVVSVAARTILGVAIGVSVTPELVARLPAMALTVSIVPVYILVIGLIGVPFFRRVFGMDRVTAYYAAMPGGLQDMVIFGQEAGGDVRALSLIHATRVLIIVTVAPLVLTWAFGQTLDAPVGAPTTDLPPGQLAWMVAAAVVGWKGAERVGLFGASILGPMIVTAILSYAGILHERPPREAVLAAQYLIGASLGVGYVGVTLAELRRAVVAGGLFVLILAALAAAITEMVVVLGLAQPVEGFLSFAPGGQAEMVILAIVSGADLGFIVIHHVVRVLIVITGAPLAARLMHLAERRRDGTDDPPGAGPAG